MDWGIGFRGVLLYLSFAGLCEWVRRAGRVNRFVAPSLAAFGVITTLMAAGLLGVLQYGAWLLYIVGALGWLDLLRARRRPDWILLGAGAALLLLLVYRLRGCISTRWDDFSHWMMAADSLVHRNAFPDLSEPMIIFRSYPLGVTVFLYYVERFVGGGEAVYMIAQNFLCGAMVLAVFVPLRQEQRALKMLVLLIAASMFLFGRDFNMLQVDWLLGYASTAILAAILSEQEDAERALWTALPGVVSVTLMKSSGMFFALPGILCLAALAGRQGGWKKRMKTLFISIGALAAAFMLWQLHVSLAFPAGENGPHSISFSQYQQSVVHRSPELVIRTAIRMITSVRTLPLYGKAVLVCMALNLGFAIVHYAGRRDESSKRFMNQMLLSWGMLGLWLLMMYLTYIFDMTEAEVRGLVSWKRYFASGLLCALGMMMVFTVDALGRREIRPGKGWAAVWYGAVLLVVAMNLAAELPKTLFRCPLETDALVAKYRSVLAQAREEEGFAESGRYCAGYSESYRENQSAEESQLLCYVMHYDLRSPNVFVLSRPKGEDRYCLYSFGGTEYIEDISEWMREHADAWDGFFILNGVGEAERLALDLCPEEIIYQ